jgi:hypothetical protein
MSIDSESQPDPIKRPDTEMHTPTTSLSLHRLRRSFSMAIISVADLRKMLASTPATTAIYYMYDKRK